MLTRTPDSVTRQIAVILGTSGSGQAVLNVLQQLLGRDAPIELHGLFIEDVDLQRAAALPFAKELCRLTLSVREIPNTGFDRTVALRMRSARHALEELARRMGVSHTFRNIQGSTASLLRDTAHSADITVFEPWRKLPAPAVRRFAPGRLAPRRIVVVIDDVTSADEALLIASRLVEDNAERMTVLLRAENPTELQALEHMVRELLPGRLAPRRIVVVIDDVTSADEALLIASRLVENHAERMTVLLRAENPTELQALEHMVHELLPCRPARLLLMPDRETQHLIATVLAERADMLVIGVREELLNSRSLGLLLQQLECPICLVRQAENNKEPVI